MVRGELAAAPIKAHCRVRAWFGLGRGMLMGQTAAAPIRGQRWVHGWLGLGRGNLCSVEGTVAAADPGVVAGKGRRRARVSPAAIFSGFRSRLMAVSWVKTGGYMVHFFVSRMLINGGKCPGSLNHEQLSTWQMDNICKDDPTHAHEQEHRQWPSKRLP